MSAFEDFLVEIYDTTGKLEREQVYDIVKDPEHPLHNELEWDPEVCTREWALHQIDRKIRKVRMDVIDRRTGELRHPRAWVALRQAGGLTGFKPTPRVMADPTQAKILLSEITRGRAELTRKIHDLLAIAPEDIADQLREDFGDLI